MKLLAFHLPQFHPIPENDRWWGPGFTEWTNVVRARPLFRGHCQPALPAELGFYDLRLEETRIAQAQLARQHGIDAFCYYHYWFNGKRLLERPVDDLLASDRPDFPFCLCWANEPWSRRWLGEERDVLQPQEYSAADDAAHAEWLTRAFADSRYLRVGRRPLFLIFKPTDLTEPKRMIDTLRTTSTRQGVGDVYILGVNGHAQYVDTRTLGCDGTVDFQPQLGVLPEAFDLQTSTVSDRASFRRWRRNARHGILSTRLKVYHYDEACDLAARRQLPYAFHPSVFVAWDNSPRRGRDGIIIVGSTPARFQARLEEAIVLARQWPDDEQLVFINAWNEWAEGCHLEPDNWSGRGYLEAVQRAVRQTAPATPRATSPRLALG